MEIVRVVANRYMRHDKINDIRFSSKFLPMYYMLQRVMNCVFTVTYFELFFEDRMFDRLRVLASID